MRTSATVFTQTVAAGCIAQKSGNSRQASRFFLGVADPVLNPSLLLAGSDVARRDLEAPVLGEVEVLRIEHGGKAYEALQHGRLQVILGAHRN
jgi:hypothetical protein